MKPSFRQAAAKLLPGAVVIGLLAALIEDRMTPGGIAVSVGLTTAVVLAIGVVNRRPRRTTLLVGLAVVAIVAFVGARVIG
jgi:hypothetical protein